MGVDPIEELLGGVLGADPLPARFACLDDLAVDFEGRPGDGVGAEPDGGVHGDGGGEVARVVAGRPVVGHAGG